MISVREARPDDADPAQRVFDEAFAAVRRIYRPNPQMMASIAATGLVRLVAEIDTRIVGTVRYRVDGEHLRVIGLAVAPADQRRGIARRLVERLIDIARDHGCRALALFTIKQTGNVVVFEHLGFEVISEQPDTLSISVDGCELIEVYLERPITTH